MMDVISLINESLQIVYSIIPQELVYYNTCMFSYGFIFKIERIKIVPKLKQLENQKL